MNPRSTLAFLFLSLASGAVFGAAPAPLPEPGSLELLAIGAVAAIAIGIRKRRK